MTTKSTTRMAKKTTTKDEKPFGCDFCGTRFTRESTLIAHMCEKRRRWLWRDEKYAVMAFRAYQKFYEMTYRSKKPKTQEDFIDSKYYLGFVKFGRHLMNMNAIDPQGFVEFLVRGNVRLEDWTAEWAYETWIRELGKKEPPERAVERNILLMEQWANETGEPWQDFFRKVNPQLATRWIKAGRISPWLFYTVGQDLLNRMSDEQLGMTKEWINPMHWLSQIKNRQEEIDSIISILKEAGV